MAYLRVPCPVGEATLKNFSDRPLIYGFRDVRTALHPPSQSRKKSAGRSVDGLRPSVVPSSGIWCCPAQGSGLRAQRFLVFVQPSVQLKKNISLV
jgi:hypothetical protein